MPNYSPNYKAKKFILILRLIASVILLQTLFFKFSAAPESVFIFRSLAIEPWGRWLAGMSELVASILLIVPATQILGATIAIGVMIGALISHLFILGIVVQNDGGLLFGLALTVLACCTVILFLCRNEIPLWMNRFQSLIKLSKK
jgi:putative oxidoreductase